MDTILLIMFGAVISMSTALTFMEVHKIRKNLEAKPSAIAKERTAGA